VIDLLTPEEAAKQLHCTVGTLAVWRAKQRKSLKYVKLGHKIYYRPSDIDEFLLSCVKPGDGPAPVKKHAGGRPRTLLVEATR
jgi:hypothetical protein